MPRYVIERELPGAGNLSGQELRDISTMSNEVLKNHGPEIQWLKNYIAPINP